MALQNGCKNGFTLDVLRYIYTPQTTGSTLKILFFCFLGLYNDKIGWFFVSRDPPVVLSWLTPQNDRKNAFTMDVVRYVYPSDNRKCPKSTFFVVLGGLKFLYYENYISHYAILNWLTIQNNRKTHLSISFYHNIYIKD